MAAVLHGVKVPMAAAHGAPLMKAGLVAGLGKAVLIGVPAALIGIGLGYALTRAFDVRWDEFSRRAADGESTLIRPARRA